MVGRLTTHVLDTARGVPARAMGYVLHRDGLGDEGRIPIIAGETDADGRSPSPLLSGATMKAGSYVLEFDVGRYHAETGQRPGAPFLGIVMLGFLIQDPAQHLHVPLLVSPFGYTTYRGS